MNIFLALVKREILEHKNIWRVPIILLIIALLVRLSFSAGNLAVDINIPDFFQLDNAVDSVIDSALIQTIGIVHFIIQLVLIVVAIFYALSCLFNERQDESVLFWRSLPISDTATVASKLFVALIVVPLLIVLCQILVSVLFLGTQSSDYLASLIVHSATSLPQLLLWTLLPVISWCLLCSQIASKNPFLMAFLVPILIVVVDKLFLKGVISQTLIINRVTNFYNESGAVVPLLAGLVFSAVCIALAILKRSQRL